MFDSHYTAAINTCPLVNAECTVVKQKKKLLLIIYSPPCHPRCPCLYFFSRKEIKVFDENIPGFFSIKWTSMGTKRFKVQN